MQRWIRLVRQLARRNEREVLDEVQRTWPVSESVYRAMDRLAVPLTVPLAGHPLHRDEAVRPFFIVGAGRSGTTLVRRLAVGHPQLHVPPEARMAQAIRVYRRNKRLLWEDLVRLTLAAFAYTSEFEDFEFPLRALVRQLQHLPEEQRSLARMLDVLYRAHAASRGREPLLWGDKTPSNARFLARLDAVFPRSRVIHVLRDGVDVAASSVAAGVAPSLHYAALRWQNEALSSEAWCRRHPQRSLTLRYEQIVRDPETATRRIAAFLGLPWDAAMLEDTSGVSDVLRHAHLRSVADPITVQSIGKGRRALDAGSRAVIAPLIAPTLERLGYEGL